MKNSICGAFPSPLFPPPSFNKRFNFADTISHIRSSLKNLSLLTSCDPRVIQFYFDGLLDFQFQDVHSRFDLSWILQELGSLKVENSQAIERMKEGSREIADEWASALRLRETFFLTLKINQSRMFSQAPLVKLIEPNAAKRSDAQRRNIKEGFKTV